MYSVIQSAFDEGAPGVKMLILKRPTRLDLGRAYLFKAAKRLQEDMSEAFKSRAHPFYDDGKKVVDYTSINWASQISLKALRKEVNERTAGRWAVIIAACDVEAVGEVKRVVREHNSAKELQGSHGRAKFAFMPLFEEPPRTPKGVKRYGWYSFYRFSVMAKMQIAVDEGATRLKLLGIQPDVGNAMTLLEYPALEEDLTEARWNGKYPFIDVGGAKLLLEDFTMGRIRLENFRESMYQHTNDAVIIVSATDADGTEAAKVLQEFYARHEGTRRQVMRAWAIVADSYRDAPSDPGSQSHPPMQHRNSNEETCKAATSKQAEYLFAAAKKLHIHMVEAFKSKKHPFDDAGEMVLDFQKIDFSCGIALKDLSEVINKQTADGCAVIIAACDVKDVGKVKRAVRAHNNAKELQGSHGRAKFAFMPLFEDSPAREIEGIGQYKWYSFYRFSVMAKMQIAVDEGATRLKLMGIQPNVDNHVTVQEYPTLEEDLAEARSKRKYPFIDIDGESLLLGTDDFAMERMQLENFRESLQQNTNDAVIIVSATDADGREATELLQAFHRDTRRQAAKRTRTKQADAGDLYESEYWYSHYRHAMYSIIQSAFDEGVPGVKMLILNRPTKPKLRNTYLFKAARTLQEDMSEAFESQRHPFYDDGKMVVDYKKINWASQISLKALGKEINERTADGVAVIIAACDVKDVGEVKRVVRDHNSAKELQGSHGRAKFAFMPLFEEPPRREGKGVKQYGWYSFYRFSVMAKMQIAVDEGATRLKLLGIQPDVGNAMTLLEYPALEEDLAEARSKGEYPFIHPDGKKLLLETEDFAMERIRLENFRPQSFLDEQTNDLGSVIIVSATDTDGREAAKVLRAFHARHKGARQVMRAWATATDQYADLPDVPYLDIDPRPVMRAWAVVADSYADAPGDHGSQSHAPMQHRNSNEETCKAATSKQATTVSVDEILVSFAADKDDSNFAEILEPDLRSSSRGEVPKVQDDAVVLQLSEPDMLEDTEPPPEAGHPHSRQAAEVHPQEVTMYCGNLLCSAP
ncbi:unnamed protein product [Symbiodinium sp. CCMP2592]|nr:unnamed protein product [Symbiodinium sp. CCMP2592]